MKFDVCLLQLEGAWSPTGHWQGKPTDGIYPAWPEAVYQVCRIRSDLHHSVSKDWCSQPDTLLHYKTKEYVPYLLHYVWCSATYYASCRMCLHFLNLVFRPHRDVYCCSQLSHIIGICQVFFMGYCSYGTHVADGATQCSRYYTTVL